MRFTLTLIFSTLLVFILLTDLAFAEINVYPLNSKTSSAISTSSTMSFIDWKNEKVLKAQKDLSLSNEKLATLKKSKSVQSSELKRSEIKTIEAQVDQNKWSLEMAQDLSSADYVVLYLSGQNNPERFKEAAAKLSSEETAKVLEAYLNAVAAQQANKNRAKLPRYSDQSL